MSAETFTTFSWILRPKKNQAVVKVYALQWPKSLHGDFPAVHWTWTALQTLQKLTIIPYSSHPSWGCTQNLTSVQSAPPIRQSMKLCCPPRIWLSGHLGLKALCRRTYGRSGEGLSGSFKNIFLWLVHFETQISLVSSYSWNISLKSHDWKSYR